MHAAAGRGSEHTAALRIHLLVAILGELNPVLVVECRSRMPDDINPNAAEIELSGISRTGFWPWRFVRNHNAIALLNPLSPNGANISSSECKPEWQLCAQFKTSRDHARRRRSRPQGLLRDRGLVRNVGARVVQLSEGQPDMLTPAAIHELF